MPNDVQPDSNKPQSKMSTQEVINFLKDDTETLPIEDKDEKSEKDDEKEDKEQSEDGKDSDSDEQDAESGKGDDKEEDKDEIELSDEDKEDKTEDDEIVERAARKTILAKYPNLFKDFPALEKAYYREEKYSELFPTLEIAQDAAEKATALDNFEGHLMNGSTSEVLKVIKEEDEEAFNRIVDNYLPSLKKVDNEAYLHICGNVIKDVVALMIRQKDEDLNTAAELMHKFIFGVSELQPPVRLAKSKPADDKDNDKAAQREREYLQNKYDTESTDLNGRVNNVIKSTIDKYIDPTDRMTAYVKKTAVRDAFEEVTEVLNRDKAFQKHKDALWEQAKSKNFSKDSIEKIRRAILNKAQPLLASAIKKARNEALKGLGKRVVDDADKDRDRKGPLPQGTSARNFGNKGDSSTKSGQANYREEAKKIPRGMSSRDYLMRD